MMSGTSLDGIDAAQIVTDGESILNLVATRYHAYDDDERADVTCGVGKMADDPLDQLPAI